MSDEDTNKREEELQKKREYQRVYEAKYKDEINRKRRERYDKGIGKRVTKTSAIKDALAKGVSDTELAGVVRKMYLDET